MAEARVQRRLAAILAADVVGYSRLMGVDEEATLRTLRDYREIIDGLIAGHQGRLFGSAGDSLIAEFASPVEALRCATEIQLELETCNAGLPGDRRMRFRIGVNLGDVMVEGDNLFGDGVNVAARLESLARAGGLCISDTVVSHVRDRLGLEFEDLGAHEVKNIAHPVRVYRVPLASEFLERSPFRGLDVFEYEHADLFHGRAKAIATTKDRLQQQAASGTAFLLIYGMSGSGKSSLARAGLLPAIIRPDAVSGIDAWRFCVFRPSAGTDPIAALAQALLGERALPELEAASVDIGSVARHFQRRPEKAMAAIDAAMTRAGKGRGTLRLAIVVDQLEELFSDEHVGADQIEEFVALLGALARSGRVWVIVTIRTDFLHRCAGVPGLSKLKDGLGSYELLSPTASKIAQIICNPARTAGLRFEENAEDGRLENVLQQAAAHDPASLPLLEFVLDALYEAAKERRLLTFADYRALGGLEGAIARRADDVTGALPAAVQAALPAVLRALTTVRLRDETMVTARAAARTEVAASPEQAALVDALVDARLLVSDEGVVRLAHEALLTHWPRARDIVAANGEFLATRARVQVDARRWLAEDRNLELLLPRGKRLAEAEDVLGARREELDDDFVAYVAASSEAERGRRETEDAARRERLELEAAAARRLAQRTRIAAAITLVLGVAAGIGAVVGFTGLEEATRHAEIAQRNEAMALTAEEQAVATRNEALRTQSLYLADLSRIQTMGGDATTGLLLALEALPENLAAPNRPYVSDAEAALYEAVVAERELAILRGHDSQVVMATFSPDGTRILTASYDRTARLWDTATGAEIAVFGGHRHRLTQARFSADGRRIVTISQDAVTTWDAESGAEIATLNAPQLQVVGSSPDGRLVVTTTSSTAEVWDVFDGTRLATLMGHRRTADVADIGPSGRRLVYSQSSKAVIWDIATETRLGEFTGHNANLVSIEFSPDGQGVLTASRDGTARVWNAMDFTLVAVLEGHDRALVHAAFSPDGTRIVTASQDRTARVWNAETGDEITVLRGHQDTLRWAAFGPAGIRVVTASNDRSARIWDATSGREIGILQGHDGAVNVATFSPDGARVITGSKDGTARLWTSLDSPLLTPLIGHSGGVLYSEFSPDGQYLTTSSRDGTARLWNAVNGEEMAAFHHGAAVWIATFDPGGRRVVTASDDGTARLWDASSGTELRTLRGHNGPVFFAGFDSTGDRVVTGSWDATAIIWNAETGASLNRLVGHQNPVTEAKFAFGDEVVLTASSDDSARVWDPRDGSQISALFRTDPDTRIQRVTAGPDGTRVLTSPYSQQGIVRGVWNSSASFWNWQTGEEICRFHDRNGVTDSSLSNDGRLVATASIDGTVRLWEGDKCQEILLMDHDAGVNAVEFDPRGARLATGTSRNALHLWDVATGNKIATFRTFDSRVEHVTFSPDGSRVAGASHDGTAMIFNVFSGTQALIDYARSIAPRALTPCERKRFFLPVEGEVGVCP